MHAAGKYLIALYGSSANSAIVLKRPLTTLEATSLKAALRHDAKDYYYSAALTLVNALQALESSMYTWATVHLYYCLFYALRARLASDGVGIFNAGRVHFAIASNAGAIATRTKENTHKTVLRAFEKHYPNDVLLSQQIEFQSPFDWLMTKREAANYGSAKFIEPNAPDHFNYVETMGLRLSLNAYLADTLYQYVFDPDHAMLAFPLKAMQETSSRVVFVHQAPILEDAEEHFIRARCKDSAGSFNHVLSVLLPSIS